jgi:hypothetical protein
MTRFSELSESPPLAPLQIPVFREVTMPMPMLQPFPVRKSASVPEQTLEKITPRDLHEGLQQIVIQAHTQTDTHNREHHSQFVVRNEEHRKPKRSWCRSGATDVSKSMTVIHSTTQKSHANTVEIKDQVRESSRLCLLL